MDIRLPLGMLFAIRRRAAGGVWRRDRVEPDLPSASLGINVNLWSGLGMLAFGVALLLWLATAASRPESSP